MGRGAGAVMSRDLVSQLTKASRVLRHHLDHNFLPPLLSSRKAKVQRGEGMDNGHRKVRRKVLMRPSALFSRASAF